MWVLCATCWSFLAPLGSRLGRLGILLGWMALLCCGPLAAQSSIKRHFESVLPGMGLEHNTIRQVYQDSRGFLWLATHEGLAVYDGHQLRFFKHEPFDMFSLSSNQVEHIVEDQNGDLWLIAGGHVNLFRRHSELFETIELGQQDEGIVTRALVLLADSANRVWIGTNDSGVFQYDCSTNQLTNFSYDSTNARSLSEDKVVSLFESSVGAIWVGTSGGGLLAGQEGHRPQLFGCIVLPNGAGFCPASWASAMMWMGGNPSCPGPGIGAVSGACRRA